MNRKILTSPLGHADASLNFLALDVGVLRQVGDDGDVVGSAIQLVAVEN